MSDLKIKIKNFINSFRQNGLHTEMRRVFNYIKYKKTVLNEYEEWILLNEPNSKEIEKQRNNKNLLNTKFLVFVPKAEDTKLVANQTYPNYEIVSFSSENYLQIIQEHPCDYCIFIGADIQLQNFALYHIVNFIEYNECNVIYCDNDWLENGKRVNPEFKPHFAYDNILSKNYIGNFIICKSKFLMENVGQFENLSNTEFCYDIALRSMDLTKIMHITDILYHKLKEEIDVNEQKKLIGNYLKNKNIKYDSIIDGKFFGQYKINYTILNRDKVSIVIPNMDHIDDLEKCIHSILNSFYENYEIIIVENNSKNTETFEYYDRLEKEYSNIKIKKLQMDSFNFSRIVNFGVKQAEGKYVVLLNNDIELLTKDWLEQMLMYVQDENVGICGALLYFEDNSVQHAGVTIGIRGLAGHKYRCLNKSDFSKNDSISYVQDLSAVTAACFMVKKSDYEKVLGFDENLAVAFNDVDFCLKIRKEKMRIIFNPFIEAYHYESKSRGEDTQSKEKQERFAKEYAIFVKRWNKTIRKGDPYFNINYRLDTDIPRINYNKIRH